VWCPSVVDRHPSCSIRPSGEHKIRSLERPTAQRNTLCSIGWRPSCAAYPGGVVDRVVQLSDGEYEAHYIGVNWPHLIFVNQDFTVVGAN
jgi:hypothetical protein